MSIYDVNLILVLISLFIIKHCICDWIIQSNHPYQYENKGKYGHPGGILHAGIAALGSLVVLSVWAANIVDSNWAIVSAILLLISGKVWVAILAEFLFHYHVDWFKIYLSKKFNLSFKDPGYWSLVGIDQMIHHLSYIVMIWYLLKVW